MCVADLPVGSVPKELEKSEVLGEDVDGLVGGFEDVRVIERAGDFFREALDELLGAHCTESVSAAGKDPRDAGGLIVLDEADRAYKGLGVHI